MLNGEPNLRGQSLRYEILSQLRHSQVVVLVVAK